MSYAVQPVSPDDAAGLANAMMNAFWRDEHWKVLWSIPLEQIVSDCAQRLPWNLIAARSVRRHLKVVDTQSGEIVGYSRYILPDERAGAGVWIAAQTAQPTDEERMEYESRFQSVTENGRIRGMNYAITAERGNPLDVIEKRILREHGPCFAVDYMSVHPAHQGRGLASMMLEEALKHADDAGLRVLVMASFNAERLYEKQGFQFLEKLDQDDSKYGCTAPFTHSWYIRQPKNQSLDKVLVK